MDWTQVLAIIGSNIALILIMFGTTVAIWLHTDKKIEAIQNEMKDFHGRLCAIEERNKK
jgi:glucose uptake protein GlcU